MNIYIGNMSFDTTEDQLLEAFQAFGEVTSVNIIKDNYSGKSKGFGFVEMASKDDAMKAISELNGKDFQGRNINVNEAKPRENRGGGGGYRGGGGGHRGGGNRGGGGRDRSW